MLLMLLLSNPYQFGVHTFAEQWKFILLVFSSTFIMPAFAVVMLKAVGLVKSLELKDRYERIGPYIITGIFYLWMFINFKNNPVIPRSFAVAVLGATIGLFAGFFVNNFTKISAHGVGMGGLVGLAAISTGFFNFDTFTLNLGWLGLFEISTNFVMITCIILAGVVSTARLYLEAHTEKQLYFGLAVGFVSQWVALAFLF